MLSDAFWTAKPLRTESFQPCGLFVTVPGGSIRLKRVQKIGRNAGDGLDRRQERFFVCLGRLVETTDLSNELKGRSLNFLCKRMVMAACTFAEPGMTISSWWKRGGM